MSREGTKLHYQLLVSVRPLQAMILLPARYYSCHAYIAAAQVGSSTHQEASDLSLLPPESALAPASDEESGECSYLISSAVHTFTHSRSHALFPLLLLSASQTCSTTQSLASRLHDSLAR